MNATSGVQYERTRCIIGVIGGDESHEAPIARRIGEEIAVAGHIVLTGGKPEPGTEVKNATLWGAHQAELNASTERPVKARMIGILKRGAPKWNPPNPCRLILETGLSSYERDAINGLTPDAMIVFLGGRGTLCELAYAAAAGKPIAFCDSAAALYAKTEEHISDGVLESVFKEALGKYPYVSGKRLTPADLLTALQNALSFEPLSNTDPKQIVYTQIQRVFENVSTLGRTGFPGLNGEIERFEMAVQRMEDCR
jgi:predicted Rossmann-fold nucleotide-binding protein